MTTAGRSPGSGAQRRLPRRSAGLVALAAAGALALGGCSAAGTQIDTLAKPAVTGSQGQPAAGGGGASASPSPGASPTPSVGPQGTAGNRAVLAANNALSQALFGLVNASNRAKADNSVRTQRQGMAAALGSERTALAGERNAAYGTVRSCPRVDGYLHTVRSEAGRVAGLRVQLLARTAKVRADLRGMSEARAVVVKRLAAMESAAKAAADSSPTPVVGQVKAALAQESRDEAAILASVRAAEQKAAATVTNAYGIRANALKIAYKAC